MMKLTSLAFPLGLSAAILLFTSSPLLAAESENEESAPRADSEDEPIPFAPPRLEGLEDDYEAESEEEFTWGVTARLRLWGDRFERPAGEGSGQGLYHQTRLGGLAGTEALKLIVEADLLAGRILGHHPATPLPQVANHGARPFESFTNFDDFDDLITPRKLYLEWQSPIGMLRAGLQTSDWGLGLLAKSGDDDAYFFGNPYGGDRVMRALFATAPLRVLEQSGWYDDLYVALGADIVIRDENADYYADDDAYQFLGSLLFDQNDLSLGTYIAHRNQTDADGSTLSVTAIDLYGQKEWSCACEEPAFSFRTAFEAVYLRGDTTRADAPRAEGTVAVDALGIATELGARHTPTGLGLHLYTGFASGDANPRSPTLHRFRFDPNYRAGMLLFDHHLPAWTRNSVDGAADVERLRDTPRGIENLIESGSITNALYLHPVLEWAILDELTVATGILTAFSHRSFRDLLATFEAGGELIGLNGARRPGKHLGWEAQLGLRYHLDLINRLNLEAQLEGAYFQPGEAFDDANGNPDDATTMVRAYLTASW